MDQEGLRGLDPRVLGQRLQEARRARGLTQQHAAEALGVARTTITAIEKGERRVQPQELVHLGALYGRAVGEFLRPVVVGEPFVVQLRAVLAPDKSAGAEIEPSTLELERLAEDYVELERLCGAPLTRRYPEQYRVGAGISPETSGEDIAASERQRLGLGDGPLLELREVLEGEVGLRIFYIDMPSKIAAMFAHTDALGGCIAVNRKHPEERRRMSLAHDYAHFLVHRYRPEVTLLDRYHRQPEHERLADAFARSFLMPSGSVRRRSIELRLSRGGTLTPADLCALADTYFVSVEALTLRLEALQLIPLGTWERLKQKGFRLREAQAILGLAQRSAADQILPSRYEHLAVEAYERGDLSEGQLARFLRADRVEARRIVERVVSRPHVFEYGDSGLLQLDFGDALPAH